jgi:hypothetical protein
MQNAVANGTDPVVVNFGSGFSAAGLQLNGSTVLNGTALQLTDSPGEAGSAFWAAPVNVQSFTNDFTFQLTNASADGFTFTIQGVGPTALGPLGGGLGYGSGTCGATSGISNSVAVKFDLYNNCGEGINSTGLYTDGASPTIPATALGGGVNLHSGDVMQVQMVYDGTKLTMTITDTTTAASFTISWPINIPGTVGGNTAYVGFTGGTGGGSTDQQILNWTYGTGSTGSTGSSGTTASPAVTPVITPATGSFSSTQTVSITDSTAGAKIFYTLDGSTPTTSSTAYTGTFTVSSTTTVNAIATATNFTTSAMGTSVITIQSSVAATPVITPATGSFSSTQTVSITDSTAGAKIFYTLDGSTPTTSSTAYTGTFTVSATTTVQAIATATNFTTSATASSVITIQSGGTTTKCSTRRCHFRSGCEL